MTQIDFLTYGSFAETMLGLILVIFLVYATNFFFWISDTYLLTFINIPLTFFMNFFSKKKLRDSPRPWQVQFQDSASPQMEGLVDLYADIMCFVIALLIFLTIIIIAINKHHKETPENLRLKLYPVSWEFFTAHIWLEILWTVIPMIVLIAMSIPSFSLLYALEDNLESCLWVKIVGSQWYWRYECNNVREDEEPIDIVSTIVLDDDLVLGEARLLEVDNYLILPLGANVKFMITSDDVLHSWAVPALGVKVDACPGRLSVVSVHLKRRGFYYGQCSEICGANHAFMPIFIIVEDRR